MNCAAAGEAVLLLNSNYLPGIPTEDGKRSGNILIKKLLLLSLIFASNFLLRWKCQQ